MNTPLRAIRSPTCLTCMRALAQHDAGLPSRPFFVQIRGKKKKPNRHHVQIVKLLSDVTSYGPKDTIIGIPPGQMRNYWYRQGLAQYVTAGDLTEVKRRPDLVAERDFAFGKPKEDSDQPEEQVVKVDTKLLSPRRSEELLQTLLPDYIEIFRPPISAPERSKMQFPEADVDPRNIQPRAIFGSVSTADILQNIKEYMTLRAAEAANADAGRVVFAPEDIKLLQSDVTTGLEDDRIKFLGEFEFELHVRGAGTVSRKVRVSAQT